MPFTAMKGIKAGRVWTTHTQSTNPHQGLTFKEVFQNGFFFKYSCHEWPFVHTSHNHLSASCRIFSCTEIRLVRLRRTRLQFICGPFSVLFKEVNHLLSFKYFFSTHTKPLIAAKLYKYLKSRATDCINKKQYHLGSNPFTISGEHEELISSRIRRHTYLLWHFRVILRKIIR